MSLENEVLDWKIIESESRNGPGISENEWLLIITLNIYQDI